MPLLNYLNSRHFQTLLDYHRDQWSLTIAMTINTQKDSLNMNGPFRFALANSVLFVRGAVLARGNDPCSPIGKVPGLTSKNLLKLNYYKQANLNWKGGWV